MKPGRHPRSAATPPMSMTCSASAMRRFIIGISDWPPAISFAVPSYRAASSIACATLFARW